MSCNCQNAKKKDFDYIKNLAVLFSKTEKTDVQIYWYNALGVGKVYDFEPTNKTRLRIVEVIKFRNDKGEDVLQDVGGHGSKSTKPDKSKSKSK